MKASYVLAAIILWCAFASAAEKTCGNWNHIWNDCNAVSDCVLIADECDSPRIAVNKNHANDAKKYYECMRQNRKCPASLKDRNFHPIVKCDAYTIKVPGIKPAPAKPACMRLNDIVGMAINNDDIARIDTSITEAKDVDMSLSHIHETPLTLAALNAKTQSVKWLLSRKAKVNFQTTNGYTALMFAVMSRSPDTKSITDTVTLLLQSGADKSLRSKEGKTALDYATMAKNQSAIQLLK